MTDFRVNSSGEISAPTSLTLIEKVRQKDEAAWKRLYKLYSPLVCFWCKECGLQKADMLEVGQEVFIAVYRAIGSFHRDREGDSFRGWLKTITKNKIVDHLPPPGGQGVGGSQALQQLHALPSTNPLDKVDADSEAAERNILAERAIELIECEFEENTRRAFWQLLQGKKTEEVAAELQMTVQAVYTAKSRVRKRLREEFAGLLDFLPPDEPAVAT